MTTRLRKIALCAVLAGIGLVLLRLPAARAQEEPETATFIFSPLARVLTVHKTTERTTVNGRETESADKEEKYRTTAKHTDTGFELTETLISATKRTDGEEDDPDSFTQVFLDVDITVEADAAGKLLAIRGLKKLEENAKNTFNDDEYELYKSIFTEKSMTQSITDEWNEQYGALVGRTVKTGDTWTVKGKQPLPQNGFAATTSVTTVAGFKTYNGKRCVRLAYEESIDLKALSKALTASFRSLPRPDGMKPPVVTATRYVKKGERLVDPKTMETLFEKSTEVRESTIKVDGMGSFTMVEEENTEEREEADSVWRATAQQT